MNSYQRAYRLYLGKESDMKYFLNSHGVREEFRPGALSVRCFILLMDLNKGHLCFDEVDDTIPAEVKSEEGFQNDV